VCPSHGQMAARGSAFFGYTILERVWTKCFAQSSYPRTDFSSVRNRGKLAKPPGRQTCGVRSHRPERRSLTLEGGKDVPDQIFHLSAALRETSLRCSGVDSHRKAITPPEAAPRAFAPRLGAKFADNRYRARQRCAPLLSAKPWILGRNR